MPRALWMVLKTALLTALTIAVQYLTYSWSETLILHSPLMSIVQGAVMSLLLLVTTRVCGLLGGLAVSVAAPLFAGMMGQELWALVPCSIAAAAIECVVFAFCVRYIGSKYLSPRYGAGILIAAFARFGAMSFVAYFILPIYVSTGYISEQLMYILQTAYTYPQLLAVFFGGFAAFFMVYVLLETRLIGKDYLLWTGDRGAKKSPDEAAD